MSPLRKLWVDPMSISVNSRSPFIMTEISRVLSVRMPARACSETTIALAPAASAATGASQEVSILLHRNLADHIFDEVVHLEVEEPLAHVPRT
jgi:hypothetical protein